MAVAMLNAIGGYDYSFVDKPHDRYICKICYLPSKEPYLSECCGHLFCKSCLDSVKKAAAISNACPICCDKEFKTFRNKAIDREIRELQVFCANKEKGCEWQGELNDINNHLGNSKGCQFEEVKCSNECGKMIEHRYLTNHVETECPRRKVNCHYCHDTGEHQFIEGQHKEECPKLPLPCPNNCEVGSVPREDMEAHRKECPLEMIQCEYHNVGCKQRLPRKDLEEHKKQKLEEHLMRTTSELIDTKAQLGTVLSNLMVLINAQSGNSTAYVWPVRLDTIATILKLGNQACPVTIKMEGYNHKKGNEMEWYSGAFYTHNKGYKMCLRVNAGGLGDSRGTHLSVFLYLMKGSHDDVLTWPLRGKFEIKLLNQISDSEHHSMTVTYDHTTTDGPGNRVTKGDRAESKCGWGRRMFISNKSLQKITATYQYLKYDSLFFQVTILD